MANPNGQPLECDAVEARLLDLVCGELAEGEAGAVRAHAAGCDACGRSLAKLEGGRAIARKLDTAEDAPPPVMSAVLAAARAKAGENQRAAARARIAATEAAAPPARSAREGRAGSPSRESSQDGRDGSWLGELLRKLGSIATGPQVAMALLLLLMVGIGLWSAPRMTSREHGGGTAVLQPDPDGEVAPSAGALTPAEPLRLEVDPRTDRIIDAEELARAEAQRRQSGEQRAAQVRPPPPAQVEGERAQVERGAAPEEQAAAERRMPERSIPGAEADISGADDERAAVAALETELAPGEGVGRVEPAERPEPSAAGTSVASVARDRAATSAPEIAPPPVTAPQPVAPSQRSSSYGATADSVEAPALDTGEALAASLHQQAREAGSSGRYAQCVSTYQQVLDRYPTYAQTGRALLEMAECQRRMGQVTVAERTLERAQRYAAVRPDAERRLSTLRAERAAMDRAAPPEVEERATSAAPASAD